MKNLTIIIAFLFCWSCNAQLIPITQQGKQRNVNVTITPPAPPTINNMSGEDDYLNAYYYPSAGSTTAALQTVIDTYDAVRLDTGTYGTSTDTIFMSSNKKIYGYSSLTSVPNIKINTNTTNLLLNGLKTQRITVNSGVSLTNSVFNSVSGKTLVTVGGIIEDNTFVANKGEMWVDNSSTGYFRNNKIIKFWTQGASPQLDWKGNETTPSYGNLQMWINHLTSGGNTSIYDGMQDITAIGLDAEQWNISSTGTLAAVYVRNSGTVKITDMGGGNGNSIIKLPAYDIEADNLTLLRGNLASSGTGYDNVIGAATNVYSLASSAAFTKADGGFEVVMPRLGGDMFYNNVAVTATITDPTTINNIKSIMLDTEKTPIARPSLDSIPNPTGSDWASERIGKPDSAAYIQGLVDTNDIAQLTDSIYYIGSTITLNNEQGIEGMGTGKTAIVGLTDDFPLITFDEVDTNNKWFINNITLQGGHTGLRVQPTNYDTGGMMVTGVAMHDVIFRDQTYGIHLYQFFGLDNNFFENVNFVSCDIGLFQEPGSPVTTNTEPYIMYVDKTVFYRSQIIDCGIGFSMIAGRPNNLDAWIECVFDGNGIAVDMVASNYPLFINCDFKNHTGDYVIGRSPSTALYNCDFTNNNATATLKAVTSYAEGSNFNDNEPLTTTVASNPIRVHLMNSTVAASSLGAVSDAVLSNTAFPNIASLNKRLVNVNDTVPLVLIDEAPTPYPMFLVQE